MTQFQFKFNLNCTKISLCALLSCLSLHLNAGAQAPTPGGSTSNSLSARSAASSNSSYARLPISPELAVSRLEELKNSQNASKAKDFQEKVNELCEWLSDMADAHWRLHLAFAKSDSTRVQAENEKQASFKFSHIKRQAMLLKADSLIRQGRYPEALAPLVDIVAQEPKTDTGISAYKLLQDIGFAKEASTGTTAAAAPAPAPAALEDTPAVEPAPETIKSAAPIHNKIVTKTVQAKPLPVVKTAKKPAVAVSPKKGRAR